MYYYYKQINEVVPIMDVMNMYGLDTALNRNVRCPSSKHEDKNASAKIYYGHGKNNCYCFSCQKNFSPTGIVMEMEGLSSEDLPVACDILCERFGLDKREYGEGENEKEDMEDLFPYSYDDLKLIGLERGLAPHSFKETYKWTDEYGNEWTEGSGKEHKLPTLKDLYRLDSEWCDREMLTSLIYGKVDEKIRAITDYMKLTKDLIEKCEWDIDFETNHRLYDAYIQDKEKGSGKEHIPNGMNETEWCNRVMSIYFYEDYKTDLKEAEIRLEQCNKIKEKTDVIAKGIASDVKKNPEQQMVTIGKEDIAKTQVFKELRGANFRPNKMKSFGKRDIKNPKENKGNGNKVI